jgi:Holliday junction resolvasome RuvABC endonuclease subunit
MIVLGIDPGSEKSGFVFMEVEKETVLEAGELPNDELRVALSSDTSNVIAIERIRGYGIVSGDDTFDTCEWVGRFRERAAQINLPCHLIPRKDIKRHLCGNTTTNDKYVRQALIDRFGEVGTKKNPGPLFGVSGHAWSALAVAVTAMDTYIDRD